MHPARFFQRFFLGARFAFGALLTFGVTGSSCAVDTSTTELHQFCTDVCSHWNGCCGPGVQRSCERDCFEDARFSITRQPVLEQVAACTSRSDCEDWNVLVPAEDGDPSCPGDSTQSALGRPAFNDCWAEAAQELAPSAACERYCDALTSEDNPCRPRAQDSLLNCLSSVCAYVDDALRDALPCTRIEDCATQTQCISEALP